MVNGLIVQPPRRVPILLRPVLWLALDGLIRVDHQSWEKLAERERLAARYAEALSQTPVRLEESLASGLRGAFSEREIVVLALAIAQVNLWSRFNQGLGIPAAGFFDERACPLPQRSR